tara:strand:- start:488 stop:688 length:201 start_codon:yes stop_codon:yes gene_type:complete
MNPKQNKIKLKLNKLKYIIILYKMPKKAKTDWMIHLQKTYKEKKAKNPAYKYSSAMKDAKKTYKKK